MLGEKIKQLRISQGLSQTEFAKRLFVTPGAVSQWEKNRTAPDTERLMAIAKEFSIPLDYFSDKQYSEAELIKQQVLIKLNGQPKTVEARIISTGIDRLPKEQREQAVNVMKAVFAQYADYFVEKGTVTDDT